MALPGYSPGQGFFPGQYGLNHHHLRSNHNHFHFHHHHHHFPEMAHFHNFLHHHHFHHHHHHHHHFHHHHHHHQPPIDGVPFFLDFVAEYLQEHYPHLLPLLFNNMIPPFPPPERNTDLYRQLQIPSTSSIDEVQKAWKDLAFKYHPDKCKDGGETFKNLNKSKSILTDPEKKAEYDRFRSHDRSLKLRWSEIVDSQLGGGVEVYIALADEIHQEWVIMCAKASGDESSRQINENENSNINVNGANEEKKHIINPITTNLDDIDEDTSSPPREAQWKPRPYSPSYTNTESPNTQTNGSPSITNTPHTDRRRSLPDSSPTNPTTNLSANNYQNNNRRWSHTPESTSSRRSATDLDVHHQKLSQIDNELEEIQRQFGHLSIQDITSFTTRDKLVESFEQLVRLQSKINGLNDIPSELKDLRRQYYKKCCQLEKQVQNEISRRFKNENIPKDEKLSVKVNGNDSDNESDEDTTSPLKDRSNNNKTSVELGNTHKSDSTRNNKSVSSQYEQQAFRHTLKCALGAMMAHAGKIPTEHDARLQKGLKILHQFETLTHKEIKQLKKKYPTSSIVYSCMKGSSDTVEHFLGWLNITFIEGSHQESTRDEASHKIQVLVDAFNTGTPWFS